MNPISPVPSGAPVLPIWAPTSVSNERSKGRRAARMEGLPPFWRTLQERLEAAADDKSKFRLLTQLAERGDAIPDPGPYLPMPTDLHIAEDDLGDWTRDQAARVRARLARLLLGGNVIPSWPLYALQYQGRFDGWWDDKMYMAAKRYVAALRSDSSVFAALPGLGELDMEHRSALVKRMLGYASTALDIAEPISQVIDHDRERDGRDADTQALTPICIRFYPSAFAKGSISLIVTVFHEAVHAEQMGTMQSARDMELAGTAMLSVAAQDRAEVLELSAAHLDAISVSRRNDYYYYLYRYATESEREAHGAELVVAMFAAACPELSMCQSGVLADIGLTIGGSPRADRGTDALVRDYVKQRSGFDMAAMCPLLEQTLAQAHRRWPALHQIRQRERVPVLASAPRAVAKLGFEAAADQLAARNARLRPANRRPTADAATPAALSAARQRRAPIDELPIQLVWDGLLGLEKLRDPSDRSGLLVQALLSESPKLFYGPSGEARFLRFVIATSLDAHKPLLMCSVRHHLEQRFGCKLVHSPSPLQFAAAARALRQAWYSYTSDLSRKILFEVACDAMGYAAAPDAPASGKQDQRRRTLKRAILDLGN